MTPANPRKYVDGEVWSVGLVRHGANRRYWAFTKGQTMEMNEILKSILDAPLDDGLKAPVETASQALTPEGRAAAEAVAKLLHAFADQLPADGLATVAKAIGFTGPGAEPEPTIVETVKALPPEAQAMFKALTEQAEQAKARTLAIEKRLAEELVSRRRSEVAQIAKAKWQHVGKADELADLVLRIEAHDAELSRTVGQLLTSLSERVGKGDLFRAIGSNEQDTTLDDPMQEALRLAKKGDAGKPMTLDQVFKANPELYEQYRSAASQKIG